MKTLCTVVAWLLCTAQLPTSRAADEPPTTPTESPSNAVRQYDALEASLIQRLADRKKLDLSREETTETIQALGHLRSKKAKEVLLQNLDFCPFEFGGVIAGSRKPIPISYPAIGALMEIGDTSLDEVIAEILKTKLNSDEELTCCKLGAFLYGASFIRRARELADGKDSKEAERWKGTVKRLEFFKYPESFPEPKKP